MKRGTVPPYGPVIFAVVFAAALAYIAHRLPVIPEYPTYEYHNVRVISQHAPDAWWIEREDGPTLWNCCPDFPCASVIWAGYIMDKFRYEDRGGCKSILRSDLGVWWKRDPITKNVKEIR